MICYLHRASACRPGHWFAKPSEASAVVCASHGWLNIGADKLQCSCCSNVLTFPTTKARILSKTDPDVTAFVAKLRSGHHSGCPWAHPQPTHQELVAFPTCHAEPICQAFVDRINKLATLDALPPVASKGLQKLVDGRLYQVLSLLDASKVPVKVFSRFCLGVCEHRKNTDFRNVINILSLKGCFNMHQIMLILLLIWLWLGGSTRRLSDLHSSLALCRPPKTA